jgi:hypothetical protein
MNSPPQSCCDSSKLLKRIVDRLRSDSQVCCLALAGDFELRSLVDQADQLLGIDRTPLPKRSRKKMSDRSSKEIVDQADKLAERIARACGWTFTSGNPIHTQLDKPRSSHYWNLAAIAFEELQQTDINDALSDLEDGD